MKRGIGVALIVLLLALATALLLSARQSARVMEAAGPALRQDGAAADAPAGEAVPGAGALPCLDEMRNATGRHADDVEEALEKTD